MKIRDGNYEMSKKKNKRNNQRKIKSLVCVLENCFGKQFLETRRTPKRCSLKTCVGNAENTKFSFALKKKNGA